LLARRPVAVIYGVCPVGYSSADLNETACAGGFRATPAARIGGMEPTIFKYVLRYSKPQQVFVIALTLVYFPFQYLSLELPKIIVNDAVQAAGEPPYILPIFGIHIPIDLEQIGFLLVLCFVYLGLVLVTGLLKYYTNVYRGRLGERMLRRLRYQLYSRILRFPLPHFRRTSQGEIIPMITAEVEPLGGFMGDAFAGPLFNGGQLIIILGFIMIQNWWLGVAAIALYPLQIYLIPKLQRKVNQLGKRRVQQVRKLSGHIGETISGVTEVHANDTSNLELARFTDRMWQIYQIRYEIFIRKFFIKFLNNFIAQLTPFFFLSIGGWLVIEDQLTIGALLAVLAAYKDISPSWKELLNWYQQKEDMRIKYEQVVRQFAPKGMLEEELQHKETGADEPLSGDLVVQAVSLEDDDGTKILDGVSFSVPVSAKVGIVGDANSGKGELAQILARLLGPTRGSVTVGGRNLKTMPEAVTGRRISYVGPNAYLYSASLGDNLTYGLKHRPQAAADDIEADYVSEASLTGNIAFDYNAEWISYDEAGVPDEAELLSSILIVLKLVELDDDVYRMGLRGGVDPVARPDIADSLLKARYELQERLADPEMAELVEPFDVTRYNTNATVAENLLFGKPVGDAFDVEHLAENAYVRGILDKVGLTDDFLSMGRQVAETMIELFADLPPGHEFFERFSFIRSEDLPDYQAIISNADRGLETLEDAEKLRLLSLPFKLAPARHRLGLIDDEMQARILEARRMFAESLPEDLQGSVAFFTADEYNPAATVQDNILCGKIAHGQAQSETKIGILVSDVIESLALRDTVIQLGLEFQVGVGGSLLSVLQRQKASIARALVKRPDILIVNDGSSGMDPPTESRIMNRVLDHVGDKGAIYIMNQVSNASKFSHIIVMQHGRVAEPGDYAALRDTGAALPELLAAS